MKGSGRMSVLEEPTTRSLQPSQLAVTRIRPQKGLLGVDLQAIWDYRELLYFLIWRDLKVRYKQTILGFAWAIIPPIARVLLFTVIFGRFIKTPTEGVPYPLYAYAALLPWSLFSGAINRSGTSLVQSAGLISKVYFPRLVVPLSAALGALADFAISLVVLACLMLYYQCVPTPALLTLPLWAGLALSLGFGVGLGLSAINVRFRDVTFVMTLLVELWMYASPVVYSLEVVEDKYRFWYDLNPMVGCIQGFRWAILHSSTQMDVPWVSAVVLTGTILAAATFYFNQVERSFADVI